MKAWAWIVDLYHLFRRGPTVYVPEHDPDVRMLRLQRRQSERALRHFERRMKTGNIMEDTVLGCGEDE